jgi:hypothetical protein
MNLDLDELSRKAARGELAPGERERWEALLREHPQARAQAEWDAAFTAQLAEKVDSLPVMPGWARTERALQAAARAERARRPGVLDRISDWIDARLGWSFNLQAAAAALVLAQAGVIGVLALQQRAPEYSEIRSGAQGEAPSGPLLRVSFRPDLTEGALRQALAEIGGEIVGGPGQLGVYLVRVKAGGLERAAERLRATGTTQLVEIVDVKR